MSKIRYLGDLVAKAVTPEQKTAFVEWLMANLKPGDKITGVEVCGADRKPEVRVFSHWESGYPRRSDGRKILPSRIWRINGRWVRETPYVDVIT